MTLRYAGRSGMIIANVKCGVVLRWLLQFICHDALHDVTGTKHRQQLRQR